MRACSKVLVGLTRRNLRSSFVVSSSQRSLSSDLDATFTEKTPITIQLWKKRHEHQVAESASKAKCESGAEGSSPHGLVHKVAAHSRVDVHYALSSDASLRHIYRDSNGDLLLEKFLEDLDALAGNVAFFHCDDGILETSPLALVTASVEQIQLFRRISSQEDIVLSGQVVWVGSSSLDVLVEAHQYPAGHAVSPHAPPLLLDPRSAPTRVLSSVFTYVARSRETGRAAQVNPLVKEGMAAHEEAYRHQRCQAAAGRKQLHKAAQAAEENVDAATKELMVELVDRGKAMVDMPALGARGVLMSSTSLENAFICQASVRPWAPRGGAVTCSPRPECREPGPACSI